VDIEQRMDQSKSWPWRQLQRYIAGCKMGRGVDGSPKPSYVLFDAFFQ